VSVLGRWKPEQYLKYEDDRIRPAEDLMRRIPPIRCHYIFDLGCGTGNITKRLRENWPGSVVAGIDSSAQMLAHAMHADTEILWVESDIRRWRTPLPADLIFSNAVLQWIPEHESFLISLIDQLREGGVLAVQMPRHYASPANLLLRETLEQSPWKSKLSGLMPGASVDSPEGYWKILSPHCRHVDIWETEYLQVLRGPNPVLEWMLGSALVPFLAHLCENEEANFLADYGNRLVEAYSPREDGRTLFPFRRIFLVAQR
jgi:trans-aconitate 2-methyltransferase